MCWGCKSYRLNECCNIFRMDEMFYSKCEMFTSKLSAFTSWQPRETCINPVFRFNTKKRHNITVIFTTLKKQATAIGSVRLADLTLND